MPDSTPLAPGSLFNRNYFSLRAILLPTTNNVVTLATAQFLFINHHQSHSSDHIQCKQEVTWPSQYLFIHLLPTCKIILKYDTHVNLAHIFRVIDPISSPFSSPLEASDRFQRNMLAKLCRGDFRKTLLRATEDLAFEDWSWRSFESMGRFKGGYRSTAIK